MFIKRLYTNLKPVPVWWLLFSFVNVLLLVGTLLGFRFEDVPTQLHTFSDRMMGMGALYGVDVAVRTKYYIFTLAIAAILMLIQAVAYSVTPAKFTKGITNAYTHTILALFSVIYYVLFIGTADRRYLYFLITAHFFNTLILLLPGMKQSLHDHFKKYIAFDEAVTNVSLLIANSTVPLLILVCYWTFISPSFYISLKQLIFIFTGSTLLQISSAGILSRFTKDTRDRVISIYISAVGIAALSLTLFPLANELQYYFAGSGISSYSFLKIIVLLLLAGSVAYSALSWKKKISPRFQFNLPLILFTGLAVLGTYKPILPLVDLDVFHLGEKLITTQELFLRGSIPFISILPTHGLSVLVDQMLYSMVYGYRPYEPLIWLWAVEAAQVVLLFVFLRRITGTLMAFLILLTLPVYSFFDVQHFGFVLIVAFALSRVLQNMSIRNSILFMIVFVLSVLWRIDLGISAIAASAVVLVIYVIHALAQGTSIRKNIRHLVSGVAIVLGVSLIIAGTLFLFSKTSPGAVLPLLTAFISQQAPVAAYATMIPEGADPLKILFLYGLIPVSMLGIVLYSIYRIFWLKEKVTITHVLLLFLAVFTLVMSIRATQRHSLIEGLEAKMIAYSMLCIFCIGYYLNSKRPVRNAVLFLAAFLIYWLTLGIPMEKEPFLGSSNQVFSLYNWSPKESRVQVQDPKLQNIQAFLTEALPENTTFFDFSNAPLLYIATEKEFIPYLIPNLYHSSDSVQKHEIRRLEAYVSQGKVPFVIFKQGSFFDQVDDLPNEVRSYRIAEYLYRHYAPYGYIGGFFIWKHIDVEADPIAQQTISLPLSASNITPHDSSAILTETGGVQIQATGKDPYILLELPEALPATTNKYTYFRFSYSSTVQGPLQVFAASNTGFTEENSLVTTLTVASAEAKVALVPPTFNASNATAVRIDIPEGAQVIIEGPSFISQDSILLPAATIRQQFDLKKLPYVWGTYDTEIAKAVPIEELAASPAAVIGTQQYTITEQVDRSKGNYVLAEVQSDRETQVTISHCEGTAAITFTTTPGTHNYAIRISTLWEWMAAEPATICVTPNDQITINKLTLTEGD